MSFSAVHKPLDDIQNCMKWSGACILSKQASLLFYLMLVGWFIVGTPKGFTGVKGPAISAP